MRTVISTDMILKNKEITIDGYVHFSVNNSYGEDADGKRAISVVEVKEVSDVAAYDKDMREIKLAEIDIDRAKDKLAIAFLEGK